MALHRKKNSNWNSRIGAAINTKQRKNIIARKNKVCVFFVWLDLNFFLFGVWKMEYIDNLPPMDLMRSEKMTFVQLIIPVESAHPAITYLGQLGLLQFRDVQIYPFSMFITEYVFLCEVYLLNKFFFFFFWCYDSRRFSHLLHRNILY